MRNDKSTAQKPWTIVATTEKSLDWLQCYYTCFINEGITFPGITKYTVGHRSSTDFFKNIKFAVYWERKLTEEICGSNVVLVYIFYKNHNFWRWDFLDNFFENFKDKLLFAIIYIYNPDIYQTTFLDIMPR